MGAIKNRVERLERQDDEAEAALIVIGEPTPAQKAAIERGRTRATVFIPDNGRDHGRTQGQDRETGIRRTGE